MKTTHSILSSLFLLLLFVSACEQAPLEDTNQNNQTSQQEMLQLVNEVRAKGCNCGNTAYPAVDALIWNENLATAAQKHSDDMKAQNNMSHIGSDGSSSGDRARDAGYNWSTVGENIAAGQTSAQQVMNDWLGSAGHCKNIMNADFKEMGAANSGTYWTQVFGAQ